MMLDPTRLYDFVGDSAGLDAPVLLVALPGFVDAGAGSRLAAAHLRSALPTDVVVRFDADQLVDYRSRRPMMVFNEDHYEDYEAPEIAVYRLRDGGGTPFLLLAGPEPDLHWESFVAAVRQVVERLGVRLVVGLLAIPLAVPHTRPLTLTGHATRPDLVPQPNLWKGAMSVPSNVGALLELRLGEAGYDAMGFAVHVPHYLAQAEHPAAAVSLLEAVAGSTGLLLPLGELREAAGTVGRAIDEQVRGSEEVQQVVTALERQYDAYAGAAERRTLLSEPEQLPSADEIGAELERFLSGLDDAGPGLA